MKLPGCLLLIVAIIALAGCSDAPRPRAASTPQPARGSGGSPVTITWSYWGDPPERSINERIVRLFEAEHPEIRVMTRWAPYGEYVQQLKQWQASGDTPDVSFMSDVPEYAAAGQLTDLTPFIAASKFDLPDFYAQGVARFRYNGGLYGLPRDTDTKVIFFNKDLFDAAHTPLPQADWTWDDLRRAALALTTHDASPRYGFAFETSAWWKLWVWQNGGEEYDDPANPKHLTLDTSAALDALRFLRDLIYVDRVTPPVAALDSSEQIGNLFAAGRLAMAFGNHALVPLFAQTPGLHWGVVGLPKQVKQVNYAGGAGYVISAHTAHPQEAWTFLTWLLGSKGEAIFTESGLIVPSRRSVGNSNLFLQQGLPVAQKSGGPTPGAGVSLGEASSAVGRVFLAETERGRADSQFPGYTAVADAVEAGLKPIWEQGADPEQVVRALTPAIEALLGRAR